MTKSFYTEPLCEVLLIQVENNVAATGAQTPTMTEEDDPIFPA